jgi:hypothetical protein
MSDDLKRWDKDSRKAATKASTIFKHPDKYIVSCGLK